MQTLNLIGTAPEKALAGLQALEKVDFSMIFQKLKLPAPEGKGWTDEVILEVSTWYRRFLALAILEPGITIVPNGPIDEFWHAHILDTQKYAEDCQNMFGRMLHHYPYFGIKDAEDAANRDRAFDQTNKAYQKWFGSDCTTMPFFTDFMNESSVAEGVQCGGGGGGTGCQQLVAKTAEGVQCGGPGGGTGCQQK